MSKIKIPPKNHVGPWIEVEEGIATGDPEMLEHLEVALETSESNRQADLEGWERRISVIKKQLQIERQVARSRKGRSGTAPRRSRSAASRR